MSQAGEKSDQTSRVVREVRGYAATSYGQIHYRSYGGRDDRPPLVLLHQSPSSSVSFRPLVDALDGAFRCFAFDTPGFGMSDPLQPAAELSEYSDAVFQSMTALGLDDNYLFGHHTGAGIAIQLAKDQPQAVNKMCLSGPPLLSDDARRRLRLAAQPIQLMPDGSHLVGIWERHKFYAPDGPLSLVQRETVQNLMAVHPHETYSRMLDTDFVALMSEVPCPTLLTAGEGDTLIAGLAIAHSVMPDSRIEVIKDAGIHLLEDQPEALAALLISFFEEEQSAGEKRP